ncbi:uncharacterized protein LOC144358035 [Saccoglossus kowalevskii]
MKNLIFGVILYCFVFTASCLTNHYCTKDQGYDPSNIPGILFVYTSWEIEPCGLDGFHVTLAKYLAKNTPCRYRVYSTVLEVSEEQRKDAKKENIHLIEPRKKGVKYSPSIDWFVLHESFFPSLKYLYITHVVGYSLKTAIAAATIQEEVFSDAKLLLINHVSPYPDSYTREKEIDKLVYKAAAFISIGPTLYNEYQNIFRLPELHEKPHVKLLPLPSNMFMETKVPELLNDEKQSYYIFTHGDFFHSLAGNAAAESISEVEDLFKKTNKPDLTFIMCSSDKLNNSTKEAINEIVESSKSKIRLNPSCLSNDYLKYLKQSHLCIIPEINSEYSFAGIEAVAVGVPVLVAENSQIAAFIKEVSVKIDLQSMIVKNPSKSWKDEIINTLLNLNLYWDKSAELREIFTTSNIISQSYKEVVALLDNIPIQDTTINECPECSCKSCLKLTVRCVLNTTNSESSTLTRINPDNIQHSLWLWKCTDIITRLTINNRDYQEELECAVHNKCPAVILGYKEGSLIIYITFPNLFSLYTFQGIVTSGTLAKEFDKILISEEMRYEAALLDIPYMLNISYDEEQFRLLAKYFINRDGGNSIFSYINDNVKDSVRVNIDEYEEDFMSVEELHNLILKKEVSHAKRENDRLCTDVKDVYKGDGGNSILSNIDDDVDDNVEDGDNINIDEYEEDFMSGEELHNLILKKEASHAKKENDRLCTDVKDVCKEQYSELQQESSYSQCLFIVVPIVLVSSICKLRQIIVKVFSYTFYFNLVENLQFLN